MTDRKERCTERPSDGPRASLWYWHRHAGFFRTAAMIRLSTSSSVGYGSTGALASSMGPGYPGVLESELWRAR